MTVLAAVATVVTVGALRSGGDGTAAPAAPAEPVRRPWQVTLHVEAAAGYVVTTGVSDGARQTLTVQNLRLGGSEGTYGGEVTAFPPGTLDETQFRTGEDIRDLSYLTTFTFVGHAAGDTKPWRGPAVGRRDPSGAWIVVYADTERADGGISRSDLLRLAAAVTLGPPRDLRLPIHFGPTLPADLRLTYVRWPDQRIDRRAAALGFSSADREPSGAAVYPGLPPELDVAVLAGARDAAWRKTRTTLTGATRVAGLPAWYSPGARLTVEAERCVVTVESARPRADLEALIESLTIGDCADPESWIPPLG
ncbi:hypothetical protein DMB66_26030 [Actinoplanes sp. ATCC 53533]|nr:hypothetical protein DMB66_26030 [Actinoplanes sp. ATCC 53533]